MLDLRIVSSYSLMSDIVCPASVARTLQGVAPSVRLDVVCQHLGRGVDGCSSAASEADSGMPK
jgi:hypothetical protein